MSDSERGALQCACVPVARCAPTHTPPPAPQVEKPALHLPWEYHLSRVLERRLREQGLAENLQCFVRPASLQLYRDGCSMLMACEQRGTLQDLINVYQRAGLKLSEELLMHHTAQMLRAV